MNEEEQDALDRENREIFCEPSCENGNATLGGLWCDYFGKDGCRACTFKCVKYGWTVAVHNHHRRVYLFDMEVYNGG